MTAVERVPDAEQRGWNAGYLAGEQERIALACALDACRYDLQDALRRIHDLERGHQ